MIKFNRQYFLTLTILSHLGLIVLFILGSWLQLLISFFIFVFLCSFASTAIYHRLLSHRSWSTSRFIECTGSFLGIFTFTGTPLTRTLSHRYHHQFTDTELDPHSPRHLGVIKTYFPMVIANRRMDLRYIEDLLKDHFHTFLHRHYLLIIITVWLVSFLILDLVWTLTLFVVPGAMCWMNISFCNILCHFGQREVIVNSRWLALITFGEGFHKNHHNNPNDPDFSFESSPLDLGYLWIRLLRNGTHKT